jgi:hypothetical protein
MADDERRLISRLKGGAYFNLGDKVRFRDDSLHAYRFVIVDGSIGEVVGTEDNSGQYPGPFSGIRRCFVKFSAAALRLGEAAAVVGIDKPLRIHSSELELVKGEQDV